MEYIALWSFMIEWFVFSIISPFFSAFIAIAMREYPILILPLLPAPLFYLGTCILATVVAYRLEFHKYILYGAGSAWGTLLGCLFLWVVYFPRFIHDWRRVAEKRAHHKLGKVKLQARLIVFAIVWNLTWLFWSATVLPEIFPSTLRLNENAAKHSLRAYHDAQVQYRAKLAAAAGETATPNVEYCDNFRNLYYGAGTPETALISKKLADAFAGPTAGTRTMGNHAKQPRKFRGYFFLEDPYIAKNNLWKEQFGMVAYPQLPGRTGHNMLWIGTAGEILSRDSDRDGFRLLTEEESPLHEKGRTLWNDEWQYLPGVFPGA